LKQFAVRYTRLAATKPSESFYLPQFAMTNNRFHARVTKIAFTLRSPSTEDVHSIGLSVSRLGHKPTFRAPRISDILYLRRLEAPLEAIISLQLDLIKGIIDSN